MFHRNLSNSILAACLVTLAACDEIDDEQARTDLQDDADADASEDRRKVNDAPEELDPDASPDWSELDLAAAEPGVEGPGGTTCCVDCGDGWAGWYNLGPADNCNSRAATFCHNNGWYFINAEWRYYC